MKTHIFFVVIITFISSSLYSMKEEVKKAQELFYQIHDNKILIRGAQERMNLQEVSHLSALQSSLKTRLLSLKEEIKNYYLSEAKKTIKKTDASFTKIMEEIQIDLIPCFTSDEIEEMIIEIYTPKKGAE